jgi:hypothetical protein
VGSKLDDLILDLQPCFALGEQTSVLQVLNQSLSVSTTGESWNRLVETLSVLAALFQAWDDSRKATANRRTPEVLVSQLKSLNGILSYMGFFVSETLRRRFEGAPDYMRETYKVMIGRYS